MVYYLSSSGRNSHSAGHSNFRSAGHSNHRSLAAGPSRKYGLSDMSVSNLKKHQVAGTSALMFLVGVPIIVMIVSVLVGLSKPQYMSDVDPQDATKRVVNYGKVFGYSFLYALIAGVIAFAIVKSQPDSPTSA